MSRHWQGHEFAEITEERVHHRGAEQSTGNLSDRGQQQMEIEGRSNRGG